MHKDNYVSFFMKVPYLCTASHFFVCFVYELSYNSYVGKALFTYKYIHGVRKIHYLYNVVCSVMYVYKIRTCTYATILSSYAYNTRRATDGLHTYVNVPGTFPMEADLMGCKTPPKKGYVSIYKPQVVHMQNRIGYYITCNYLLPVDYTG